MAALEHVEVAPQPLERFRGLLGGKYDDVVNAADRARELFAGRVIWQVNSTGQGGGVAEMLRSHLAYVRASGVDTRWVVAGQGEEFFRVTKRLHNHLHGAPGDRGELGASERAAYEAGLASASSALLGLVRPGDVALIHDPQPAGMIPDLRSAGVKVLWRAHIGADEPNDLTRAAWDFLRPYVEQADSFTFSRRAYVWDGLDPAKTAIVPPSIDPFSPKNQDLDPEAVTAILQVIGLSGDGRAGPSVYRRTDGTPARVDRAATIVQDAPLPGDARLVTQVSRWDRLKDPLGVIDGFARAELDQDVHLLLAGPDVSAVTDDPEGVGVLAEVTERRASLDPELRARTHIVSLPMIDIEENAAMVNALQRRSDVVVQKSVAEGFGLTVSEAMWKDRPMIASRVGGMQDQIVDGVSGVLIDDARDLDSFGAALSGLLADPAAADRIGEAAHRRVAEEFLVTRRLIQYFEIFEALIGDPGT
jgi:trehalose synthase